MTTTFSTLQTAIKARLKEAATDATTVARIKECINMAYFDLCSRKQWSFLKVVDAEIAGTGVRSYAIADAADKVINVRWGTSAYYYTTRKLTKTDREILLADIDVDTTEPYKYCINKNGYIETDGIVASGYTLYYDYIKKITELSADDDECLIPDRWIHVLKQLAYYYALDADDDDRAKNAFTIFTTVYSQMLKDDYNGDEFDCMGRGYEA